MRHDFTTSFVSGLVPQAPAGAAKSYTLTEYGQLWARGMEGTLGGRLEGPSRPASQSLWVNACITALAETCGQVPLRISVGQASGTRALWGRRGVRAGIRSQRKACRSGVLKAREGDIVESGELHDLLAHPGPGWTGGQFVKALVGMLYSAGRVHVVYDEMIGRRPRSLILVPGKWTRPLYDERDPYHRLTGWEFRGPTGATFPLTTDESLTFQLFNPDDPQLGLSPITPANLAIVADWNASTYNAAMFGNNCEPGGILRTDAAYSQEQDDQIRTTWRQRHGGAANARQVGVLWGGLQWEGTASTMADMRFIEGKQMSRVEICAAFRVPPSVAGFFGTAGDSTAYVQTEQQWFLQATIAPLTGSIAEAFTNELASRFEGGQEVWADLEEIPAYQQIRNANLDAVDRLWAKGVPLQDLSEIYDLGLPDQPQHRIGFLPISIEPAASALEPHEPSPGEVPPLPEELRIADCGLRNGKENGEEAKSRALTDAQAEALWRSWNRSIEPVARRFAASLKHHLSAQQRLVIAALKREFPSDNSVTSVTSVAKSDPHIERVLMQVFDDPEDVRAFRARVRAFAADASDHGITQALTQLGLAGDELKAAFRQLTSDPRIIEALNSGAIRISTRINEFNRGVLRRSLGEGLNAGESVNQLADRVQGVMQNRRADAVRVARNTVGQANSQAQHVARQDWATHEIWVHSRRPGVRRASHVEAEVRYRSKPKPIGVPFLVHGVPLRFPRDPAGPPGEIVNCQCVVLGKRIATKATKDTKGRTDSASVANSPWASWSDCENLRRSPGHTEATVSPINDPHAGTAGGAGNQLPTAPPCDPAAGGSPRLTAPGTAASEQR